MAQLMTGPRGELNVSPSWAGRPKRGRIGTHRPWTYGGRARRAAGAGGWGGAVLAEPGERRGGRWDR